MKDKFIITISDIHGSKQYTLSQFIKVVVSWIIIAIVVMFMIGLMVMNYLSKEVDRLESDKKELKQHKEILIKQIIKTQEELNSMDEQLKEARKLIGLDDTEELKQYVEAKHKKEQADIDEQEVQEAQENKAGLKKDEFELLSRMIPNGKPLEYKRISTKFGMRRHPITKRKHFHSALDLAADIGTPIYAPADGVVVYAGKKRFYGNFLLINHAFGFATAYGHLQKLNVKAGEYVKKGDLVALCGNTGRSTGPHVHYELRYLSKWLDPEPFMKEWSYDGFETIMRKNTKKVQWNGLIEDLKGKIYLIKHLKNKGD